MKIDSMIGHRLVRPRFILWMGSTFEPDAALLADLPSIPFAAIFQKSKFESVERVLAQPAVRERRWTVVISDGDELDAWKPSQPALIYVEGREGGSLPPRRQLARHFAMLAALEKLAESSPIIIGLGLDRDMDDLAELLESAAEYAPLAPIVLVGDAQAHAETLQKSPAALEAQIVCVSGGWCDFRASLEAQGFQLVDEAADVPAILVGKQRVELLPIFRDPEIRVDDEWRLITARALAVPPQSESIDGLFRTFMCFDERKEAANVETDVREWWAIRREIPAPRPAVKPAVEMVLKRLGALSQAVAGSAQSPPVRCWLPAEPGSGATTLLHQIAFAAAERGYPVLLLKQAVTEIDAWRLLGFLSELQRRAKALRDGRAGGQDGARDDEDPAEVPALLVLDTCHAGRTSIESLPDLLVRKSRRKVLTLWAMPVDEGRLVVPQGKRPSVWYGQHVRGFHDIQPADDDVYLSALPAGVLEPEFNALRKHVVGLRERGVLIADRDEATWREFQRGQVFRAASHLDTGDGDRDEIARFFRAEELFWVLLFHFLSAAGANPIAEAWGRRLESLLGAARWEDATPQRRRVIALLLEIAKTSNWGIVIPQSLLVDWLSDTFPRESTPAVRVQAPATSQPLAPKALSLEVERLRRVLAGEVKRPRSDTSLVPLTFVPTAVEELTQLGVVRSFVTNGRAQIRVAHRVFARILLREALETPDLVGAELHKAIGGTASVNDENRAYAGLTSLLASVRATHDHIGFCEYLSEAVLVGEDGWSGWRRGNGEGRLQIYEMLPPSIRQQSRVLRHHHAMVLRRTVRSEKLANSVKLDRLLVARSELERALEMPWRSGARDEHPSHIMTTLGLVLMDIADLKPSQRDVLSREAIKHFEAGLDELPHSRHARLALALLLVKEAERGTPSDSERVGYAARALRLLSIDPTGRLHDWYETKHKAASLFSDEKGQRLLEELKQQGVEDAFLLDAELHPERLMELLVPLVVAEKAHKHHRAARRLAEHMSQDPVHEMRFAERQRLLRAVEAKAPRLTPEEEFQLAWLDFQLTDYARGASRFRKLRDTRRADLVNANAVFLCDETTGKPEVLEGLIQRTEQDMGWMAVRRQGNRLFEAPFRRRHFAMEVEPRKGAQLPVLIRFTPRGPTAVPLRFQGGQQ